MRNSLKTGDSAKAPAGAVREPTEIRALLEEPLQDYGR